MNKKFKLMVNLPMPVNISYMWNFGSILGLFLMIQIISGFFLSINYCSNIQLAFISMIHIIQNVKFGWLIHNIHMNGASMYFIFLYLHISRGMYFQSFMFKNTWNVGISIYLISMLTAFLGYVLPWGQMSFWGATVITNLISTFPYIGMIIVQWIWGGFSINNLTLNRFYSFHFILPFLIIMLIFLHLYFLHLTGSSNPLGINSNLNMITFYINYIIKDLYGFMVIIMFFLIMILYYPYKLSDPDNFIPANSMITPIHIQPEWYFLFAYAILRSIPNKLGGVIALLMSILIFYLFSLINFNKMNTLNFYYFNRIFYWFFINNFIILTWLGAQLIEYPFMNLSQLFSLFYFMYFFLNLIFIKLWDLLIYN